MESSEENTTIADELKPLESQQDSGLGFHSSTALDSGSDPILDQPSPLDNDLGGNMTDHEIQNPRVGDKCPETREISGEIREEKTLEKEDPYQQIVVDAFQNLTLEGGDSEREENTVLLDERVMVTGEDANKKDAYHEKEFRKEDKNVKELELCSDVYDDDRYGKEVDNGIQGSGHLDSDINLIVQTDENDNPDEGVGEEVVSLLGSTSGKYRRPTFPVRLDAEDCAFYIRNGTCKFGSSCKFNHPPWRKNQATNDRRKEASTDRPGQTECKVVTLIKALQLL